MNAKTINEAELARHLPTFLSDLGLSFIDREVKIGAYRLDAIAADPNGTLVVVEFKTNASITTLSQLLLYPHALRKALAALGIQPPRIRSLLITTFLDSNVHELSRDLASQSDIEILVCTGTSPDMLTLVAPENADGQVWDQIKVGSCKLEPVLAYLKKGRV
jgi:hypothetical protein